MIKYFVLILSFCCLVAAQAPVSIAINPKCTNTTVKPNPTIEKYYVNVANTTKPCLVVHMSAYISLGQGHYLPLENGTVTNSSQCNKLTVSFECAQVNFSIVHSNETKTTFISDIGGYFQDSNHTVLFTNSSQNFVTTQSGHYYKCNAEQLIKLEIPAANGIPVGSPNVTLALSNFAYEAFRDVSGTDFYGVPEECPLDAQPVSDLVRVAVGICLIALVAIVLVAYFIGRRRWSERSSYESV